MTQSVSPGGGADHDGRETASALDAPRSESTRPAWSAIVLAGRRPGVDPLAAHFGVAAKALIEVDGEPMLGRVLRALVDADAFARILVLGQDVDAMLADPRLAWARDHTAIHGAQGGDGISRSVIEAVTARAGDDAGATATWPILVTTADNALLTPPVVTHFLAHAGSCDLAIGLVSRREMTARYPDVARTWLPFREDGYTGANIFALNTAKALKALEFWRSVETDRKSPTRIAAHFGPWLLLQVLLRRLTLAGAIARAGRRLGLSARPVVLPYADAGIDVDKLSDHALAERILRARR